MLQHHLRVTWSDSGDSIVYVSVHFVSITSTVPDGFMVYLKDAQRLSPAVCKNVSAINKKMDGSFSSLTHAFPLIVPQLINFQSHSSEVKATALHKMMSLGISFICDSIDVSDL